MTTEDGIQVTECHLHPHLIARMRQRGITRQEIERVLNEGWEATDTKPGISGRVLVFPFQEEWEGQFYQEKEVTVYYKLTKEGIVLLTAKARYGKGFPQGVSKDESTI